jgi:propane monooxygenase reductase component
LSIADGRGRFGGPFAGKRHDPSVILFNHDCDKAEMMTEAQVHKVRFEPVGIEMEVEEGETVLDAAFRQGISLMHGCKEGQCGSCKSKLIDGDIELLKYSTFALPDYESETDHVLLCRTHAFSDVSFELLNYDEDLLRRSIAVKSFAGRVAKISELTSDIRLLEIEIERPLKFWAGQYVDLTLGDGAITRAFSMANAPGESSNLSFIIKKYPNGAFSSQLDGKLAVGDQLTAKGPYGTCFRREERPGPMLLIGGGSGMSPLWSILADHIASGEQRPVRFFYGARTRADLFYLDELSAITAKLKDFKFIPALSHEADGGWEGETGFVHEVVLRHLREDKLIGAIDAYACGPTPMIDAVLPVLQVNGVEPDHIYFDKFTPAVR